MKYYYTIISKSEMMLYSRTNDELEKFTQSVIRIPASYVVNSCKNKLWQRGCLPSILGQYLTKKGKYNLSIAVL